MKVILAVIVKPHSFLQTFLSWGGRRATSIGFLLHLLVFLLVVAMIS
jgi:hypothetical protein